MGSRSRFTRNPAIAFVPAEEIEHGVHSRHGDDLAAARREAIQRVVGEWVLQEEPELGAPRLHDSEFGIGAGAWAVVVAWAAQGVVGGAAWVATVAAAARLKQLIDRVREQPAQREPMIAAGAARLLAIDAVLSAVPDDEGPLDTEAIEEASTVGGREPETLAYGEEPWIVLLISPASARRYFVVVESNGTVSGIVTTPLGHRERILGVAVEIPGEGVVRPDAAT
jgi:hypothetical protein